MIGFGHPNKETQFIRLDNSGENKPQLAI